MAYTDKQIKTAIVYGEVPKGMNEEEIYRYEAFSALWEEMKSVFINDQDLTPINPVNN